MAFEVLLYPSASKKLEKMDNSLRERYLKALGKLEREDARFRHLKQGLPYFVDEIGGGRVVFEEDKTKKTRSVLFVGNHDEYQEWYSSV